MNDRAPLERLVPAGADTHLCALLARVADAVEADATLAAPAALPLQRLRAELAAAGAGAAHWLPPATARYAIGATVPRYERLAVRLQLAGWQRDAWLLLAAAGLDAALAALLRAVHPEGVAAFSPSLLAAVLREQAPPVAVLGWCADNRLARLGLIEANGSALALRALTVPDAVALRLFDLAPEPASAPVALDGLEEWLALPPVARIGRARAADAPALALLLATDTQVGTERARALAQAHGRAQRMLDATVAADPVRLARELGRCLLAEAVPIVVPAAIDDSAAAEPLRLPEDFPGAALVVAEHSSALATARPLLVAQATPLSLAARTRAWAQAVGDGRADAAHARWAQRLATLLPLEPADCRAVAQDARATGLLDDRAPTEDDLLRCARQRAALRVRGTVDLRPAAASFDDLVVADSVREALARAQRHALAAPALIDAQDLARPGAASGRALRLLFAGPPGTGKTLGAEALAAALARDLLVVDAGRVLSKWLGETERNLARAFAAAEAARALLFIDEADALFARRTEVRDAHDRWANAETAFLLQRMESFDGVVVLASNARGQLDPAFTRRLDAVIEFAEPDEAARSALWALYLPAAFATAPLARDGACALLARWYPLTGAQIRAATLSAAVECAGRTGNFEAVLAAVAREFHKAGRAVPGVPEFPTV
ncbi:MAG: ATP-binding protein [Betaproteobacteria bacterium]